MLEKLRKVINAREEGLKIDRVRRARDRKIIIGCSSQGKLDKVKEKIKNKRELRVEDIKSKDPLIILKDVMEYNTDEDILKSIRAQNKQVFKDVKEDDIRMEIKYRRKTRNPLTSHIIMKVSPQMWKNLIDTGVVHVDMQRVKVMDQSPLIQCSRCLGYGHTRKLCAETIDVCSHCGGPHLRAECSEWLSGVAPTCKNCARAKLDRKEHNAFGTECPIKRKWEAIARSAIAYC